VIDADNVTLDCAGFRVISPGDLPDGISVSGHSGVTITNCDSSGFAGNGFDLYGSSQNQLKGNLSQGNGNAGFLFANGSNGNLLSMNQDHPQRATRVPDRGRIQWEHPRQEPGHEQRDPRVLSQRDSRLGLEHGSAGGPPLREHGRQPELLDGLDDRRDQPEGRTDRVAPLTDVHAKPSEQQPAVDSNPFLMAV